MKVPIEEKENYQGRKLVYQKDNYLFIALISDGFDKNFENEINAIITYMKFLEYDFTVNENYIETIWPKRDDLLWLCFSNQKDDFNLYFYLDEDNKIQSMEYEHKMKNNKDRITRQKYRSSRNFIEKVKEYITLII